MFFSRFNRSRSPEEIGTEPPVEYPLSPDPIRLAEHIPLRLTMDQRKVQRLMRGIILGTHYTDKVDREDVLKGGKRDHLITREIINAFTGLVTGLSLRKGSALMCDKDFEPYRVDICTAIEACRRYKIMNPDMLRTDYVKFLYLVQDAAQSANLRENILGFSVATPLVTIGSHLRQHNALDLLADPRLPICISPVPKMEQKTKLNKALRYKDVTVTRLCKDVQKSTGANVDAVELAIRSLNDANHFANDNVVSTENLLELLRTFFSPLRPEPDLSITEGTLGSRLTHNHAMQYSFVLQSLTLWKNICRRMYSMWSIAETDMLDPNNKYELRFTGQGLQRVQAAPNLLKAICDVLEETKRELGQWVGSERIHLGDNQVPNAFHFIDKYGQISRILIPILRTLDRIDELIKDKYYAKYIEEVWGSAEGAKVAILRDFFRHGFDGSGGDNMDDAGSCIDGRLTSAWNWCNSIQKKPFYPLFLFAGFNSFDGDLTI